MTDIVMNLFIFFFISFSLLYTFSPHKEAQIEVKLPEGQVSPDSAGEAPFILFVTSGNEVFIGQERVPVSKLEEAIRAHAEQARTKGLLVKADKDASVDTLVKVLDAAKQSGAQKLGVAIQTSGKSRPNSP